jgi:Cu/Ag efflux protein CusF
MRTAKFVLTGAAAIGMLTSVAFAADDMTGVVTKIDRLNSTITIQETQKGTVGGTSGGSGSLQEYKAKDAAMLDSVHAGDRVNFSATDNSGSGTITALKKQ